MWVGALARQSIDTGLIKKMYFMSVNIFYFLNNHFIARLAILNKLVERILYW
ncbi:putative transmembrane protein [Marinomonas primoryensis]|uniref:Putative transmembrane protein n=1 Tax=Marinomonas primoryensis TaxID=178399 RepID=A0A859D2J4_9GAMM|nr:putative transmembrane protein [Marinomonas primoryensis]